MSQSKELKQKEPKPMKTTTTKRKSVNDWLEAYKQQDQKLAQVTAQRDELLAALKACETDENALGYSQPAKYACKRFDAINATIFAAISKAEQH